ncbi:hypothetical protein ACQP00_16405 [Dactylosporangium sp. CS-047395]|uniref:hypothetical protein n=1 Tax=Dactylosporangium sp. CS-047395 TaxID=3239936 RepID=UPI003D91F4F6
MYDEGNAGAELRRLMLTADVPAARADLDRAIADGQRAGRRRLAVLTAAAAGIAVLAAAGGFAVLGPDRAAPAPQPAVPSPGVSVSTAYAGCKVTRLPGPDGGAEVSAMDPSGTILGGDAHGRPVLWRNGRVELLEGVHGGVYDIAADGAVLGNDEATGGWVWRDGHVTALAKLNGYKMMFPSAINAKGQVAGFAIGQNADDTVPVTWSPDGKVHKLTVPAGVGAANVHYAMARDLNDDGLVVGDVRGAPVYWTPDGVAHELPKPGRADTIVWAIAGDNIYGAAVGDFAVRWSLTTKAVFPLQKGGDAGAKAGSANGFAVLPGNLPETSHRVGSGRDDELRGPDGEPATALAISGDGRTVAGLVATAEPYSVIWTCG